MLPGLYLGSSPLKKKPRSKGAALQGWMGWGAALRPAGRGLGQCHVRVRLDPLSS